MSIIYVNKNIIGGLGNTTLVSPFESAKALINYYNWVINTNLDGTRYVEDEIIDPNYPLALKSGQGTYFNGTTNYLNGFTIPPTSTNMYYWKDGIFYDTTTLIDFSTIIPIGWYKDIYYFSRPLITAELTKLKEYPEQFFIDVKTGVINDCILNLPLNDKDYYARDYTSYNETINISESFNDLIAFSNKINVLATIETTRDGFDSNFVKMVPTTGGIGVLFNNTNIGTVEPFLVKCRYRTNGSSNSIACGGNNDEILPINTGDAKDFQYFSTKGNALKVYLVVQPGSYLEIDELRVYTMNGVYTVINPTVDTKNLAKQLTYSLQPAKLITDSLGLISGISPFLQQNATDEIATNIWDLLGSWTVYEIVELNGIMTMFAYKSNGNKYTNGVPDGTYTIPTSISFNGTTFDGAAVVTQHVYWEVVKGTQTDKDISNKFVYHFNNGDLTTLVIDEYGNFIIDEQGNRLID